MSVVQVNESLVQVKRISNLQDLVYIRDTKRQAGQAVFGKIASVNTKNS
jgi:hypothetical protein